MNNRRIENIVMVVCVILLLGFVIGIPVTAMINYEPAFKVQVEKSTKSVVHVMCPQWQGSGFIISEHIIATARHVVDGVENFDITLYNNEVYHSKAAISDKTHDVGFIWVEKPFPKECIARLGSIKDCWLGEDLYVIGSPYGKINFNSLTKGVISGLNRNWDEIDPDTGKPYGWEIAFTTDSAGHPGNSGGPIFTCDGVVRGILVGGYSPVLICAMPCDLFIPDIKIIRLMFIENKYQLEKQKTSSNDYYNRIENSEYYK
jgi:S1-C subfamily serine protease